MIHPNLRSVGIDPTHKGFAVVVVEGGDRLLYWGMPRVWSGQKEEFLAKLETILEQYQPCVVVAEAIPARDGRRKRARRLIAGARELAADMRLPFATVTRTQVRKVFADSGVTKYEIAVALVTSFPELEIRLPPKRRAWTNEDRRMNIFDALSFAVTALAAPESSFPVL